MAPSDKACPFRLPLSLRLSLDSIPIPPPNVVHPVQQQRQLGLLGRVLGDDVIQQNRSDVIRDRHRTGGKTAVTHVAHGIEGDRTSEHDVPVLELKANRRKLLSGPLHVSDDDPVDVIGNPLERSRGAVRRRVRPAPCRQLVVIQLEGSVVHERMAHAEFYIRQA